MTERERRSRSTIRAISVNMAAKSSSLINLVGTFDGEDNDESCRFFFQQFSQIADMAKWTEAEKLTIIKSRLRGKALRFLITDENLTTTKDFEELKHAFLEYFKVEVNISNNQMKFNNIRQREAEAVRDLAQRIIIASNNYLGISGRNMNAETKQMLDKLRLAKLVSALDDTLKTDVLKANPSNFEEAVKVATNSQNALKTIATMRINNLLADTQESQTFRETAEANDIEKLRQEVNNLKIHRAEREISDRQVLCYLCGQSHYTANCRVYRELQEIKQGHNNDRGWNSEFNGRQNWPRNNFNPRYQNRGRGSSFQQRGRGANFGGQRRDISNDRQAGRTNQDSVTATQNFLAEGGRSENQE